MRSPIKKKTHTHTFFLLVINANYTPVSHRPDPTRLEESELRTSVEHHRTIASLDHKTIQKLLPDLVHGTKKCITFECRKLP